MPSGELLYPLQGEGKVSTMLFIDSLTIAGRFGVDAAQGFPSVVREKRWYIPNIQSRHEM